MEFSRHARNRMRHRPRLTPEDVAGIIEHPLAMDTDEDGRPRYVAILRGEWIRVVMALDRPDFVVTVHRWRSR